MVDGVLPGEQELGDGDKGIALLEQGLENSGQGLRGVEGGVVEQADGSALYPLRHPLGDFACRDVLPVQTVPAGKGFKSLEHKGFRDFVLES